MPDECPNHGVYSDEQKNVAIGIVSDALTLLWEGRVPSGEGVREELRHVEIFGAIEGLPMAFVGLTFREPSKMYGKHLCYGTEVVLNQEPPEMARRIDASIREGLSSA
jgi:hypothetical protein